MGNSGTEKGQITTARALFLGALAVGIADITDAFVFFGLRGTAPIKILQSIASGLLGKPAFAGGWSTALLGLGLHFCIATGIVGTYLLVSRFIPILGTRPLLFGPIYGMVVYLVMNQIVVPLSAAGHGPKPLIVVINGVLIHLIGVGLPSALAASMVRQSTE